MCFLFFRLCLEFTDKQFILKWLSEINHTSDLLNDTLFNFYMAGLYLSKICDRYQQQIVLKLLNKTILLPIVAYAIDLESNCYNRYDLIKVIPAAACIQVSFFTCLDD